MKRDCEFAASFSIEQVLQFPEYPMIKIIDIFLFIAKGGTGCTDMGFKSKKLYFTQGGVIAFLDIDSIRLLTDDGMTQISGKIKIDKASGFNQVIHIAIELFKGRVWTGIANQLFMQEFLHENFGADPRWLSLTAVVNGRAHMVDKKLFQFANDLRHKAP